MILGRWFRSGPSKNPPLRQLIRHPLSRTGISTFQHREEGLCCAYPLSMFQ